METNFSYSKRNIFLLALMCMAIFSSFAQQVINTTLQHDGKTRRYRLYVPKSYDPNKSVPLILNFHGFTNNIDSQYNQSDFRQLAEDNQFIFATPQGLGFLAGWAINNSFGGNEDDIGFSNALIDKIENEYNVNAKRIYATGFSNGGFFSYRLACELSPRIAAVASVAGSMTRRWINNSQCQPQHPTAVLQITGTNDGVISINGNSSNEPIQDVMEYWTSINNGDNTPDVTQLGGGSTRSVWDNGNNGVTAEFIKVQGKGHSWNGGNVNTSEEIWKFFSRFDIDGEIDPSDPGPPNDTCATNINTFPYAEGFENNLGTWSNLNVGDDIDWTRNSGATPSSNTGPSNASEGNSYVYVEASGNGTGFPNKSAILNSPCFNLNNLTSPVFSFKYHMYGSTINSLVVEAKINNTGNWVRLFNKNGDQGDNWITENIDLKAYIGSDSIQLRFNVQTGSGNSGWQSDIAIDNISLQNGDIDPNPVCEALNFNNFTITSFSNQDNEGDFSVNTDGSSLSLTKNTWKYIDNNYSVTENTVLEFEFSSSSEGEIHGIGFEDNNSLTSSRYFKVHGSQNYGVTNFDNYTGGTTKYIIPVGDFYTGNMDRLVFINDNDGGSGNTSTFSNVKMYEGSCGGALLAKSTTNSKIIPILGLENEDVSSLITLYPNPVHNQFFIKINSSTINNRKLFIYDILGQKKYETNLNKQITSLKVSELKLVKGVYILKIQTKGENELIKKLIIK